MDRNISAKKNITKNIPVIINDGLLDWWFGEFQLFNLNPSPFCVHRPNDCIIAKMATFHIGEIVPNDGSKETQPHQLRLKHENI